MPEDDIPRAEECQDCGWDGTLYWAGHAWLCDDCLAQREDFLA